MKKNLKIAITGAGGFLGSSTLEYLSKLPHVTELRVLYSQPNLQHEPNEKIRTFVGDLTNRDVALDLVHGTDVVIHFANRGIPADALIDTPTYLEKNLGLTSSLLEAMVTERVPRILFASTGGALYRYDPLRKVPYHELSEIEFRSAYSLGKFNAENLLLYYKKVFGISSVIMRISNPFGKRQVGERRQGFIGLLFSRVMRNEEIKIFGNLEIVKDFLYIDDLMRVIDGFLQHPEHQGIFNVGSGMGVSLREVITVVERSTHKKVKISFSTFNPSDTTWTVLNTSKLQRTISWTCRFSMQEGVRLTWEAMKEDLKKETTPEVPEVKKAA